MTGNFQTPDFSAFFTSVQNAFSTLHQEMAALRHEVAELRTQLPEWVSEPEARRLTNLSSRTLLRLRDKQVLVWKHDHGVHYQRASLLAYNASRAIGRGRLAALLVA